MAHPNTPVIPQASISVQRGALKLKEAAEYLGGVSQITVRRLVDRGLIKPNRATRHLLFPVDELNRFLAQ